jgi:3-phosphoshikimate 1-carboxyvinyltransferase
MTETIELRPATRVRGLCVLPGDKSLSHRAIILAALSNGRCRIENLSTCEDVKSTIRVFRALGVRITLAPDGESATVEGRGGRFDKPDAPLDFGNSATAMSLTAGVLAAQPFETILTGDESLRRRPMEYVAEPLRRMGAGVTTSEGGRPPITISGGQLTGIPQKPGVASAQIKSAIILAGLYATGDTVIHEAMKTRDHTERLLGNIGGRETVWIDSIGQTVTVHGERLPLKPFDMVIPGDPSSGAYPIALATILRESSLTLPFIGINPGRIAFMRHLQAMGARIIITPDPHTSQATHGEPVGEIAVHSAELKNVPIDPQRIPAMIDELPLLSVVACLSENPWEIRGARRLREKESDRIKTTVEMLRSLGAEVEELEDGLSGSGRQKLTGGEVHGRGDHRIVMSAAVGGWCAKGPTKIHGAECVRISYPGFFDSMLDLVEHH